MSWESISGHQAKRRFARVHLVLLGERCTVYKLPHLCRGTRVASVKAASWPVGVVGPHPQPPGLQRYSGALCAAVSPASPGSLTLASSPHRPTFHTKAHESPLLSQSIKIPLTSKRQGSGGEEPRPECRAGWNSAPPESCC